MTDHEKDIENLKLQIDILIDQRNRARDKLARIMVGLEGCCMTCEPVGVLNQQMDREIATLKIERDEARMEVAFLRPSVCLGIQTAHNYAKQRGWDCFENKSLTQLDKNGLP